MSQTERAPTPLFMDLIVNSCIHQSRLPTSSFIPRSPPVIPLNSSCQQQAICLPVALLRVSVSSSSSSIMLARHFILSHLLSGCSYTVTFLCFVTNNIRQGFTNFCFKKQTGPSGKITDFYSGGAQFKYRPEDFIMSRGFPWGHSNILN
jgi:hypothetical protein